MFVQGLYSLPMVAGDDRALLRIGELARRLGVSQDVLRAWERRYGLLEPVRSSGGFRLYTAADEQRVRRMQSHLARGLAAAEAARAALAEDDGTVGAPEPLWVERPGGTAPDRAQASAPATDRGLAPLAADLRRALDAFDEPAAEAVLDRLFADFSVETALRELLLPYLHELGARWAMNEIGVATEHFASNVLRARLAGLARGWGQGRGPCAVLACPPGEQHDLPLMAFGIVLHRNGWRIVYLGADTPLADLGRTVEEKRPEIVVLAAVDADRFQHSVPDLAALTRHASLRLAGAGATTAVADAVGATVLAEDPVTEAQRLTPPV
ncbi:B12 binding protein [Pseudonocardia cypriaca]|uniref:B12 binding protein n=2 Tax=Pseudonocardia cypriaca TaxID=882449 RepID=A0A543GEQ2_9PSEU|nr:B12 binding protein [Pseudonocardia cypriaca]